MNIVPPLPIAKILSQAVCLYSIEAVQRAIHTMAQAITASLAEQNPVLLCTMVGGIVTTGQLLPRLNFPLQLDYLHLSRYGDKLTGGTPEWITTPRLAVQDRNVLVIDDILDGGVTLAQAIAWCEQQGAKQVESAVLVTKQRQRAAGGLEQANYSGMTVQDKFVFGCGMDYKGYLRNAPGIFAIPDELANTLTNQAIT